MNALRSAGALPVKLVQTLLRLALLLPRSVPELYGNMIAFEVVATRKLLERFAPNRAPAVAAALGITQAHLDRNPLNHEGWPGNRLGKVVFGAVAAPLTPVYMGLSLVASVAAFLTTNLANHNLAEPKQIRQKRQLRQALANNGNALSGNAVSMDTPAVRGFRTAAALAARAVGSPMRTLTGRGADAPVQQPRVTDQPAPAPPTRTIRVRIDAVRGSLHDRAQARRPDAAKPPAEAQAKARETRRPGGGMEK